MTVDKKVIQYLNEALKGEITAINQYFLHSHMLDDWGITKLAKHERAESIEEMHHADELIKRIMYLGGLPNLQDLGKLHIGQNVKEVIEGDLILEKEGIAHYRKAIAHAENVNDYGTRDLLAKILSDEEGHEDYLETQLKMIENMGLQNYIMINSESPLDAEG